ncbi:MAG: hypothetical protein ABSF87_17580 [Xanthobacteraceae bacterium]|jgi:hypothetical protein
MTAAPAEKNEDVATPEAPDLQKLVARFGQYDRITPAAWAEFDREMEMYQAWLRRK